MHTLLEQSTPTGIDIPINEPHLQRKIGLRMKHSYHHAHLHEQSALTERLPPRLKHIDIEKLCRDWSKLVAATYRTAWSAFLVETYTIPHTDYDDFKDGKDYEDHIDYNDFSEHNSYGQSKSAYHISDFRLRIHLWQRRLHVTIITYAQNKLRTTGSSTAVTAGEWRQPTKIAHISYGRRHYELRLPPPVAALSGQWLEDPINWGDMDNTSFYFWGWDPFCGTQSIYIYTSNIRNYYYWASNITSPYSDMEWTQNYKWICWMRPSRCGWYQTTTVEGPNPVKVNRSLCRSYHHPNNILLSQPPFWTAQEQVDMWMLLSSGNMSVARDMLLRQLQWGVLLH